MATNFITGKFVFKPNSTLGYYLKKGKENFPEIFTSRDLILALRDILRKYNLQKFLTENSIRWNKELEIIFRQESTNQNELKPLLEAHILPVPANVSQLSLIQIIQHVYPAITNDEKDEASTSKIKYRRTKK